MKKSSSLVLISGGILATIISVVPMTSPVTAQTSTPGTNTQEPRTTTTANYDNNDDNTGLWGLAGLTGLLGLLGRKKEEDNRQSTPAYRDPNVR